MLTIVIFDHNKYLKENI